MFSILIDNLGYLNIFILTYISGVIPFIPIPFAPIIIIASFNPELNPNIIALIGALGVTAGRTSFFMFNYYGGGKLMSPRIKKNISPLKKFLKKYGWIGSFIAALTPFPPDDFVIILLGITKFSPWKFVITTFAGKLIANLIVVWGAIITGKPIIDAIFLQSQNPTYMLIIVIISISIIALTFYSLVKINWQKVIGKWFPWTLDDSKD